MSVLYEPGDRVEHYRYDVYDRKSRWIRGTVLRTRAFVARPPGPDIGEYLVQPDNDGVSRLWMPHQNMRPLPALIQLAETAED